MLRGAGGKGKLSLVLFSQELLALLTAGLGIVEGFLGYGLPDDVLSGTGLRAAFARLEIESEVGRGSEFSCHFGAARVVQREQSLPLSRSA